MAIEITDVPSTGVTTTRTTKKELGKDDFLLLLTKQLQNQDPLKPMDNMEFVSQMANFTSLEQMTNMNKSMEQFITSTNDSYKVQAMGMLGMNVTAALASQPEPVVGLVSQVKFVDGEAVFKVGESQVKMSEITKVEFPEV